ncbi:MAG: CRISPR system precrRNA processing endoribonuclease RAMP protein Cas6 [Carbonactinosporaceae bacterium]
MPISYTLRLQTERPVQPETRHLHGLACVLFESAGSDEHAAPDKPFTVWPLTHMPGAGDTVWELRASWLPDHPPAAAPTVGAAVRLGAAGCEVTGVDCRAVRLAALAEGPPIGRAHLRFRSPTFFVRDGADMITPDVRLILGSYRRRWNASLPGGHALRIDDDTWRALARRAAFADFNLTTARMDTGHGRERTGFVGTAILRLSRDATQEERTAFSALVRFAPYAGTGGQTTHGFGATELVIGPAAASGERPRSVDRRVSTP